MAGDNIAMADRDDSMFATSASADERYHLNEFGFGTHQAIVTLIRDRSRVLDVGCADGSLGAVLQRDRAAVVTGLETDRDAAALATTHLDQVIQGDVTDEAVLAETLDAGPFDQIVLGDVLEHTVRPDLALHTLRQVLAPGGSFVISLPNVLTLRARMTLLRGVWKYEDTGIFDRTHLRFFSVDSARQMVAEAGLRIINELYVGPLSHRLGRRGASLTALRPGLLATQVILEATPTDWAASQPPPR